MMTRRVWTMGTLAWLGVAQATAAQAANPFVRWAELEIDAGQAAAFDTVARENANATWTEPGVIAFHFAAEKSNPNSVRVLEIYRDEAAYRAHVQTPHFKRFAQVAQGALLARRVHDTEPIVLGAKSISSSPTPHVRVAELDIAPKQLASYKAAVIEEINASIKLEPGVLAIYALSLKDAPHRLRFFEIYADEAAYRKHIASPHFKQYVETTSAMITSRKVFEMANAALGPRPVGR